MARATTTQEIPRRLACRDQQQSFEQAYADHVGIVQYALRSFHFSAQDEEDLTQEIFLRFFNAMEKIDSNKVRAYLITVTKNAAINLFRRRKSRGENLRVELNFETLSARTLPDSARIRQRAAVSQFLDSLHSDPQAKILVLFYDQELGVKEIAARTKESVGTITSRLTRCRQKYKNALEAHLAQSEQMSYIS